jgi:uncharacterized membrane protein YkoI
MYRQKLFSAAMATAVVLAGTGAAYAESNDNASEMAALSNAKISLSQAISAAEQKAGGRAIDAGVNNENGVITYGVEIAKGNTVQMVLVDPATGEVTKIAPTDSEPGENNERNGKENSD